MAASPSFDNLPNFQSQSTFPDYSRVFQHGPGAIPSQTPLNLQITSPNLRLATSSQSVSGPEFAPPSGLVQPNEEGALDITERDQKLFRMFRTMLDNHTQTQMRSMLDNHTMQIQESMACMEQRLTDRMDTAEQNGFRRMYNVHCSRGDDFLFLPLNIKTNQPAAINSSIYWGTGVTSCKISEADANQITELIQLIGVTIPNSWDGRNFLRVTLGISPF